MNPVRIARTAVADFGALQKPGELAGFLAVLADDPPKVVVEIGADAGGTLWAWRQAGADMVVAVTLKQPGRFATGRPLDSHGATVVYGDSHDVDTVEQLTHLLDDRPVDLLFIDGDHTYDGCLQDVLLYGPLVRPGGIVALHDIVPHPNHPDVGVQRVWQQIVGDTDEIVTDDPTWGGIGWVRAPFQLATAVPV